jgi:hypothetical protein
VTTIALSFPVDQDPVVAFAQGADGARTFAGLAVPFGVASGVSQDGHRYRFSTPPENADELVDVVQEHDTDALVGRLAAPWSAAKTGLSAVARIFTTTRGNDVMVEATEGARTGFSVGARISRFTEADDGVRDVAAWTADHLGVVRRPAFSQTRGFAITCSAATTTTPAPKEHPAMETTELPTVAELAEKVKAELAMPTVAELAEKVREILKTDEDHHPLAAFGSFREFAAGDPDKREALQTAFAIPDQITGNNPGVIQPGWRTEIKMRLDARRPAIEGTGGSISLPDSGMDVNWPFFDGDLDTIVAQQLDQKSELSGVRIDIEKGSASIKTAGTVSDISYQLLMRSSPDYLAAYLRIVMAAWARYTEAKYEAALLAQGTEVGVLPSLATAAGVRAALFAASADVEDATGAPASLVLVDRATFITLGGVNDLYNGKYGTQNASGTSDASSLTIEVNGLQVKRAPFFPASTMVVTNSDAAKFPETGPRVATEEDVSKLGRDVAVWGMYADAEVYFPAGVRVYQPA